MATIITAAKAAAAATRLHESSTLFCHFDGLAIIKGEIKSGQRDDERKRENKNTHNFLILLFGYSMGKCLGVHVHVGCVACVLDSSIFIISSLLAVRRYFVHILPANALV